ncbi:MAG: hypothetical protein V1848_04110 [Candidatus Magasanikbacteria bacterium]
MMQKLKDFFLNRRNQYMLAFLGFTIIMGILPQFIRIHYLIFIGIYFPITIAMNYFMATYLQIPTLEKIMASLIPPIGFFYILGYDTKIMSEAELIRESYSLFKNNIKGFLTYSGVFFSFTVIVVLITSGIEIIQNTTGQTSGPLLGIFFLVRFFLFCIGLVLSFAFIRYIARIILKTKMIPIQTEIHEAFPLFFPAILIYIIILGLIIPFSLLGNNIFFLCGIGVLFVWYIYTIHALVLENSTAMDSFRSSKKLVKNRAWQILWRLSISIGFFWCIAFVIKALVSFPFNLLLLNFILQGSTLSIIVNNLFALVLSLITAILMPLFFFIPPTILYFELKKKVIEKKK